MADSSAADSGKTTTLKTNLVYKVLLHTHTEGGRLVPMLGDVYEADRDGDNCHYLYDLMPIQV
jgi:hypothetical protein